MLLQKLDAETLRDYELPRNQKDFPSPKKFVDYLGLRYSALKIAATSPTSSLFNRPRKITVTHVGLSHSGIQFNNIICLLCKNHHPLSQQNRFSSFTVPQRRDFVSQNRLLFQLS